MSWIATLLMLWATRAPPQEPAEEDPEQIAARLAENVRACRAALETEDLTGPRRREVRALLREAEAALAQAEADRLDWAEREALGRGD